MWQLIPIMLIQAGASYLASQEQQKAAKKMQQGQTAGAQAAIEETRRQFDKMQEMSAPYVQAGKNALAQQMRLIGMGREIAPGMAARLGIPYKSAGQQQAEAIRGIEEGPLFQAKVRQGEEALMRNVAATGGYRSGSMQSALAQYRPAMLQAEIDAQYNRLAGLTGMGQAAAAGVGAGAMQTGRDIGGYYSDIGAAQAAEARARGQAGAQFYGDIGQGAGYWGTYLTNQGLGSDSISGNLSNADRDYLNLIRSYKERGIF